MLDPGALGTLLIGLERARHEFDPIPDGRRRKASPAKRPRGAGLRSAILAAARMITTRRVPIRNSRGA